MTQQTTREQWRHLQRPVAWLRQQEPMMLLVLLLVAASTRLFIELADEVFNSSHRVCIRPPGSVAPAAQSLRPQALSGWRGPAAGRLYLAQARCSRWAPRARLARGCSAGCADQPQHGVARWSAETAVVE